ncbi:MAG: hypothetical protein GEU78_01930 [Actinobacteria bacterium]|nr:hypothetical protein [Actinomycetota bacterium]
MSRRHHKPHLELVSVEGSPTKEEERAIRAALEDMIERDREIAAPSVWKRAARAQGRRLGMLDYRDRFSNEDAWRLSTRFPFGGREYPGRGGRGDTK